MLDQRQRRWSDIVQMLYKCLVFAGMLHWKNVPVVFRSALISNTRRREYYGLQNVTIFYL